MTKLYARFLVVVVRFATALFGRWRRLTVLARVHDGLAPESVVIVNGTSLTLLVPDRKAVYWPRYGFQSEPNTIAWIEGFSDSDVLYDIGANIGVYTLYAAKARSARVVAIEPNPFSHRVLVDNLRRNGVASRVTPLCLAVGAETKATPLYLGNTEAGSVGHTIDREERVETGFEVETLVFRLDDLAEMNGLPHPTQIKIDVDGIEHLVLEGARSLLSDPALKSAMVEFLTHDNPGRQRIDALLVECGLTPATDWRDDGSDNRLFVRRG